MRENKVKKWFEENKTEIELGIVGGVAVIASYALGSKIETTKCSLGLMSLHGDGFLIFTKPSENGEIINLAPSEWVKVAKEFYKK